MTVLPPLSLYVHIPWCVRKCPYCDFNSHNAPQTLPQREYADALLRDLDQDLPLARGRVLQSIFFGGGTPSLFAPDTIARILDGVAARLDFAPGIEIALETNPGTVEHGPFAAYARAGVNRISFGVQSFIDSEAKHTGRLHTREIALRDVERVRDAGIPHINIDLIAGLPGQTIDTWRESLRVLADTGVDHASIYMLEVDNDSRLGREIGSGGLKYFAPQVPSDEAITEMYSEALVFLGAHGLAQYEISNFAREGRESAHNLKYWQRKPYLGLGLDAHSILRARSGAPLRFSTTDELEPFLDSAGWNEPHRVPREEELEEAWFLGLRLSAGVSLRDLRAEFGPAAVASFDPILTKLECDGLITWTGDRIALTPRGRLVSNEVFERFLTVPAI